MTSPKDQTRFCAILDRSRNSIKAGKGLSRDAFWKAAKQCSRDEKGVMMRATVKLWFTVVVLTLFPAVAYADVGTPLILAKGLHMLFGNAIIGVAEGLIIASLFRRRRGYCVAIMIAANYFSAWMGGLFLPYTITSNFEIDLYNARRWLWGLVGLTYLATIVLEWPFVALCLRGARGWFLKSIWGSLIVQSASYLLLFGLYWAASGTSLYTNFTVIQPFALSLPKDVTLYYIATNDNYVCAADFSDGKTTHIFELKPSQDRRRLMMRQSETADGRWNLIVGSNTQDPSPSDKTVLSKLKCDVAQPARAWLGSFYGGDVPRFRVDKSGWQFRFGWVAGGLYGENTKTGVRLDVSLETPFLQWRVGSPTQLPGGRVIFQLGEDQICILDPSDRTIALLAKGHWPVITINKPVKE